MLRARRPSPFGIQVRGPRSTASPSPQPHPPHFGVQALHLTLEAVHHNASPAPFFFPGGEDSFIFQPGPSWGQERKRTPYFHLEGRQAGGWGGKRSERSQTASLPPTSAPRSAGSDRAHRWRPRNSVPLREPWTPEEEEGRTRAPDSELQARRRRGDRRKAAVTCGCGGHSLPPTPTPLQRPQSAPASQDV